MRLQSFTYEIATIFPLSLVVVPQPRPRHMDAYTHSHLTTLFSPFFPQQAAVCHQLRGEAGGAAWSDDGGRGPIICCAREERVHAGYDQGRGAHARVPRYQYIDCTCNEDCYNQGRGAHARLTLEPFLMSAISPPSPSSDPRVWLNPCACKVLFTVHRTHCMPGARLKRLRLLAVSWM